MFVAEVQAALLRDDADLAVHSLKDVPGVLVEAGRITTMLMFIVLLGLQGLALLFRSILVLGGEREWDPSSDSTPEGG